ncbi:MAG: hypothetical protein V1875_01515 [Candidatus Altiarchaeota archaeon]
MIRSVTIVIVCLLCGCLCIPGGEPDTSGDSGNGSESTGMLEGLLDSVKGKTGGDVPEHCLPPAEARALKLSDCDKAKNPFEKYTCISAVALVKSDASICEKIPVAEFMGGCVALIASCTDDESLCSPLGENDIGLQYMCVSEVAEVRGDPSLCDGMENPNYRDTCLEKVAAATADISICSRISENSDKDNCIKAVAVAKKDPSLCVGVSGTIDYWRQECLMEVSMAAGDMALCGSLETDSRAGKDKMIKCVKNITASADDPAICDPISEESIRDYHCIIPLAVAAKDPKTCLKITDETRKITCVKSVAVAAKDASVCEKVALPADKMSGSHGKNDCIIAVVKETKDKAPCGRITDNTNAKKSCMG